MSKHPQANILRAIADGKVVQMRSTVNMKDNDWWEPADVLSYIGSGTHEFRIKPETININGFDVPIPMREPLKLGQMYFFVHCWDDAVVSEVIWNGDRIDRHRLKWGLIHSTKEAAIAHAEALLSFTRSDR